MNLRTLCAPIFGFSIFMPLAVVILLFQHRVARLIPSRVPNDFCRLIRVGGSEWFRTFNFFQRVLWPFALGDIPVSFFPEIVPKIKTLQDFLIESSCIPAFLRKGCRSSFLCISKCCFCFLEDPPAHQTQPGSTTQPAKHYKIGRKPLLEKHPGSTSESLLNAGLL